MKKFSFLLYFVPFISFLITLSVLIFVFPTKKVTVPNVITLKAHEGIQKISNIGLNSKILKTKLDNLLEEGTIVEQYPQAGSNVKTNQSIYLTIVINDKLNIVPDLYNKNVEEIKNILETKNIKYKIYEINNVGIKNSCIAQSIKPNSKITNETLNIFITSGEENLKLMPNLKNKNLTQALEILNKYPQLTVEIINSKNSQNPQVFEQRPTPNSIIDLKKENKIKLAI